MLFVLVPHKFKFTPYFSLNPHLILIWLVLGFFLSHASFSLILMTLFVLIEGSFAYLHATFNIYI